MRRAVILATAGLALAGGAAVAAAYLSSAPQPQQAARDVAGPFAPKVNQRISSGALSTAYTRNPSLAPQPLRGKLQAAAARRGHVSGLQGPAPSTPDPSSFSTTLKPTRFNLEKEGPPPQR